MLDENGVARTLAIGCPRIIRGSDGPDCGMLWRLPTLGSTPDRLCVVLMGLVVIGECLIFHLQECHAVGPQQGAVAPLDSCVADTRRHGTRSSARVFVGYFEAFELYSNSMYWFAYILTNTSSYSKCAHVHIRRNRNECASQAHNAIHPPPTLIHPLAYHSSFHVKAMLFLISAMANAGFNPLGHVREQLRIVWHRYKLMLLLSASWRSARFSSRESAIQR
jgi:hypothetical protein